MKNAALILLAVFLGAAAHAQTANDLVYLWLSQHGLAAVAGDYRTCQPDGQPDQICGWNTTNLGTQPTADQLSALTSAWQAQQSAPQTYATLMRNGVQITSTGTPAINGTYAVSAEAKANLTGIVSGLSALQGLPGNADTFLYLDASRTPHAFDSAQITALARAVRDFIYAADIAEATALAGGSPAWPSNQITIP